MDTRPLTRLEKLAVEMAVSAPLRPSSTTTAYIPWRLIIDARQACEEVGIDWADICKQHKRIVRAQKAARYSMYRSDL